MSTTPTLTKAGRRLINAILSGKYPPGTMLPPERELAQLLGASRATLREVLRQLGSMKMIEAKRSSGVRVRPVEDWTFEVLPDYLSSRLGREDLLEFLKNLLAFRRHIVLAMFRLVAPKLHSGSLDRARTLVAEAWEMRADPVAYMDRHVEVMKACIAASGNLPGLWLTNNVMAVLNATSRVMPSSGAVPRNYLDTMMRLFSTLERNDGEGACVIMGEYYDREDRGILGSS